MNATEHYPWHLDQWRRMAAARVAGRLPHAILLVGAPGLGKSAFAGRLSDALVCTKPDHDGDACGECGACRQARSGNHPDQRLVAPDEPGKPIKIDAIRELTAKSVLCAQEGGYRIYRIEPAEAMNRPAANALLKTLEEPASRSVLILVSSHPHRLPATIRSRCQVVRFANPDSDTVRNWLGPRTSGADVDELLAISGGVPLRALQALQEGWVTEGQRLVDDLGALRQRSINPLQIVEEWGKRPLTLVFDGLKRCVSDLIKLANGLAGNPIYHLRMRDDLQCLGQGIDLRQLYRFNDEILRLERDSTNNLNVQMLLEYIANRWLQITRPGGQ
ncbi:MAG: DNA polymerase III subunit delta' [Chromatiaceae bacterium]|nr:DNA polymerase III subunit delta' [Chromatiaceae bacterium]MCP5434378.1 DNA polymerase III subunit delta' [Chromatiaceae bacterium]MCW5585096.1 DNA polymerase III subunit delta' [Chromatiales bacterium]HOP17132.1 DNA polymerase III subunit delta' [Gammaproteobacteria bacterium]HPQ25155.1 DNA polymerase III subunit delta' [Gammaproteobacteria bacterium]